MKILSIGSDRNLFNKDSAVRQRMLEYASVFDELHIIVFTKRGYHSLKKDNLFIYPTNSINRWFYVFDAIKIGKEIFSKKLNGHFAEGWVVSSQDPFESGIVARVLSKKFRAGFQIQIHTDFLSPFFKQDNILNKIRLIIASFLIPRADCIRVVSRRIKDSLINKYEILPSKVFVLPIFVNLEKIENTDPSFDLYDKYPQFDFIILMASRIEKEKNFKLAFSVMQKIIEEDPRIGFVIVGDGSQRGYFEFLSKSLSLNKNIIFEGWRDDLISYYKTASLFLSTSDYEGYGMSLVEAVASHCPVVTTDVGIVGDILNKNNSFVCPVGDENCLVKSIREARRNKTLLTLFKLKAGNMLKENSIENHNVYLKSYKKILSRCL